MEQQEDDPSVGIQGCWFCTNCDHVEDIEDDDHYLDDCSREDR